MKKREFMFLPIFLAMLIPQCVSASSAAGISPSYIEIPFFPYHEETISFKTLGYARINFEMNCPFIHINNETLNDEDGVGSFTATLKLPEKIDAEPGQYNCGFKMHRINEQNAPQGIGAFAEVEARIEILIPVKGLYATMSIAAQNANKGEPVFFKLNIKNMGEADLNGLTAAINIQDINNNSRETIYTREFNAPKFQEVEVWKRLETENYEPAKYKAKASLYYSGPKPAYAETEFLVGKLFVKYVGMDANATEGKINPIKVNVESWWGNPIENVRAEIKIYDTNNTLRGEFRTESADLQPWQKATLHGYWDANGLEAGAYGAELTLLYKGGETKEKVKLALQKQPKEGEDGKAFEAIKETLTSPIFLALLVLILIINVSIWLIKQKKQGRRQ